ncbi:hypothetical protein RB195_012072 [Necator americanus]|uniref:Uncharacterized protein n=1 Tax=Necator americanus TaxID=51031 RepID=A0ABR1D5E0_NECAM
MNAVVLITFLLVVDVFSLDKTWTHDHPETGIIGNEVVLHSEQERRTIARKKHKVFPIVPVLNGLLWGGTAVSAYYIGRGVFGAIKRYIG